MDLGVRWDWEAKREGISRRRSGAPQAREENFGGVGGGKEVLSRRKMSALQGVVVERLNGRWCRRNVERTGFAAGLRGGGSPPPWDLAPRMSLKAPWGGV